MFALWQFCTLLSDTIDVQDIRFFEKVEKREQSKKEAMKIFIGITKIKLAFFSLSLPFFLSFPLILSSVLLYFSESRTLAERIKLITWRWRWYLNPKFRC